MNAVIYLDVPDWQIGQDVSIFFPDTMVKHCKCELLKEQEAVVPGLAQTSDGIYATCGKCKTNLWKIMGLKIVVSPDDMPRFCPKCGQKVKWE